MNFEDKLLLLKNWDKKKQKKIVRICKQLLARSEIYYAEPNTYIALDFGYDIGIHCYEATKLKYKLQRITEVLS